MHSQRMSVRSIHPQNVESSRKLCWRIERRHPVVLIWDCGRLTGESQPGDYYYYTIQAQNVIMVALHLVIWHIVMMLQCTTKVLLSENLSAVISCTFGVVFRVFRLRNRYSHNDRYTSK